MPSGDFLEYVVALFLDKLHSAKIGHSINDIKKVVLFDYLGRYVLFVLNFVNYLSKLLLWSQD